jgi:sugar/nucleoside kinase (ribokinase family)
VSGGSTGVEFVVLGPTYCDLVFGGLPRVPELGTEVFAERFLITAGGSAITAVALARLDRTVALVADVGHDPLGERVRAVLRDDGVSTRWLRDAGGTPTTAVLSTSTDRAFATYLPPSPGDIDLEAVLTESEARHLHVAGFPAVERCADLVARAHALGRTVSFDPGWDAQALQRDDVRAVAEGCDVLMPNASEAALLLDSDETDVDALLEGLATVRNGRVTVVKDGPRGAVAAHGELRVRATAPATRAVDATGAGDVFDAGFLDGWTRGADLEVALRRGVHAGARAVATHGGATGAPSRAALDATLHAALHTDGDEEDA